MWLDKISAGKSVPDNVNVVIEIAQNSAPVKYEICHSTGALLLDRLLSTAMHYPCNYGFIPHTLSGDGDPCDALIVSPHPFHPTAVVRARPVGVLLMEDDGGKDEKVLMVPDQKITPLYNHVQSYTDLPPLLIQQIEHFFTRYKDLEPGKWAKVHGWGDVAHAKSIINEAVVRASATV